MIVITKSEVTININEDEIKEAILYWLTQGNQDNTTVPRDVDPIIFIISKEKDGTIHSVLSFEKEEENIQ